MADYNAKSWFAADPRATTAFIPPFNAQGFGSYIALVYTAVATTSTQVIVQFPRVLGTVSSTVGNYVFSGTNTITTTAVSWTPGTSYIILTTTGTWAPSSTETLTIAGGAVLDLKGFSSAGSATLLAPNPPTGQANFNPGFN